MRHVVLGAVVAATACGPTAFVPPPPSPQRVYGVSEVDERPEIVLTPPLRYPPGRSEEHTSELQSLRHLVCRLLLEKKKKKTNTKKTKKKKKKKKILIHKKSKEVYNNQQNVTP